MTLLLEIFVILGVSLVAVMVWRENQRLRKRRKERREKERKTLEREYREVMQSLEEMDGETAKRRLKNFINYIYRLNRRATRDEASRSLLGIIMSRFSWEEVRDESG